MSLKTDFDWTWLHESALQTTRLDGATCPLVGINQVSINQTGG